MDLRKAIALLTMFSILAGLAAGLGLPPGAAAAPQAPDEPVDGYGYTYIAGVNDPWIEANSGTLLTFSSPDDGYAGPLNIGFNFGFYEQTFSQLYVSTNGLVTFGAWSTAYQNKPIPWAPTPNNLIAGLWSDLKMHNGRAYLRTLGTAPARICVVEWEIYDLPPSNPAAVLILNFEVLLYENGAPVPFDGAEVSRSIRENRDTLVQLHFGEGTTSLRFWTADLTAEYIRLNADYHT